MHFKIVFALNKSGFKKVFCSSIENDGHSINTTETYIHSQFIVTV